MKNIKEMLKFETTIKSDPTYKVFIRNLAVNFSISENAVHGYMYNSYQFDNGRFSRSYFLSLMGLIVLPIILCGFFFKKNHLVKEKYDIAFEIWNSEAYEKFYSILANHLGKTKKIFNFITYKPKKEIYYPFDYIRSSRYIDKKSIKYIIFHLIKNFILPFQLYSLGYSHNINFIFLYSKFLIAYIKFNSFAKSIQSKVFISTFDINAHRLKYEILKKNSIFYILFQESMRSKLFMSYKGADLIFTYGDNQKSVYTFNNNEFQEIVSFGALSNIKYLEKSMAKQYDFIFIDQRLDYDYYKLEGLSNKSYKLLLNNLLSFAREFQKYKILYRGRPNKIIKNIHIYDEEINNLLEAGIIYDVGGNSYEKVLQSRVAISYTSALCFESIGLEVPSLFCYYDNFNSELFNFEISENDILLRDSSYELFKSSLLGLSDKKNHDEYLKKYKKIYMNQDKNGLNIIMEKIEIFLDKAKK